MKPGDVVQYEGKFYIIERRNLHDDRWEVIGVHSAPMRWISEDDLTLIPTDSPIYPIEAVAQREALVFYGLAEPLPDET